jgi:hypothetical protein
VVLALTGLTIVVVASAAPLSTMYPLLNRGPVTPVACSSRPALVAPSRRLHQPVAFAGMLTLVLSLNETNSGLSPPLVAT